ncbi:Uncharacterised protein [Edwardsiella tarda]|nr:Uncharacterised protein [Edwardsiella tarda]
MSSDIVMQVIYFDYVSGFGVNALVDGNWDYYPSFDELLHECDRVYGHEIVLVSTSAESGTVVSYKESLNECQ